MDMQIEVRERRMFYHACQGVRQLQATTATPSLRIRFWRVQIFYQNIRTWRNMTKLNEVGEWVKSWWIV
jgi:hypothetical protein